VHIPHIGPVADHGRCRLAKGVGHGMNLAMRAG
jgi:hypothetical protein